MKPLGMVELQSKAQERSSSALRIFQHVESPSSRVTDDSLESSVSFRSSNGSTSNLPIVGVEFFSVVSGPNDGTETELQRDVTNSVVNVSVGRTHGLRTRERELV